MTTTIGGMKADRTNAEAVQAWDGAEGDFWAANAARFDRSLAGYHATFMAAADIQTHERVLDIGCGTGQTTCDAALAASTGTALGVDLSAAMLDVARRSAATTGISNASFEQADAQVHPFLPAGFDVVISRTGTMFFGDRDAAFANLGRALRPGGRLVTLVWQQPKPNDWSREIIGALSVGRDLAAPAVGAPGPFAFADPDESRRVLTTSGFTDIEIDGLTAPMWWGTAADDAHNFALGLMGWMVDGLDAGVREVAERNLYDVLSAHASSDGVMFESAAWLVTAQRA